MTLPTPFSRADMYLNYLNGNGSLEDLPEPLSRSDLYLFNLCVNRYAVETQIESANEILYGNGSLYLSAYTINTWQISLVSKTYIDNVNNTILIPVADLSDYITINANATFDTNYAFIKDESYVIGTSVKFATGYTSVTKIKAGTSQMLKVPSDTKYLYILNKNKSNGEIYLPTSIVNNGLTQEMKNMDNEITKGIKEKAGKICYVSASNSSYRDKELADFMCTGTNDEIIINQAIASLIYGGTVQLLDGDYYIDAFTKALNTTAIYVEYNGNPRVITIKGTTENKSYLSHYGVAIHVTSTAFSTLVDGTQYSVFNTISTKVQIGNWFAFPNNINFENFYLFLKDASKKIIGINGQNFGSMGIKQVGVYTENYFHDRFYRLKPATPVNGCIGVLSVGGANDEMARIEMNCVNSGGLYIGIKISGVEHLIMNTCTCSRGCYGYVFEGTCQKTLTMINCADEGNTHLPKFTGEGHLTAIDLCIERLSADVIPSDPDTNTEPYAIETTLGGWKGFISYIIQGSAFGITKLWKDGHGKNCKTVNLDHTKSGTVLPIAPEYMEQFFNTILNKMLTWNGSNWMDAIGSIIS